MYIFFFFNDTATTEIYTLSLHDALPISTRAADRLCRGCRLAQRELRGRRRDGRRHDRSGQSRRERLLDVLADRKSTRLNSSHANISYAVFCLKKKKNNQITSIV